MGDLSSNNQQHHQIHPLHHEEDIEEGLEEVSEVVFQTGGEEIMETIPTNNLQTSKSKYFKDLHQLMKYELKFHESSWEDEQNIISAKSDTFQGIH